MRSRSAVASFCALVSVLPACNGGDGDGGGSGSGQLALEPVFFEGPHRLTGTVTFASPIPSGTHLQLNLTEYSDFAGGALDTGNELRNHRLSSSVTEISWSIDHIAAGTYWVAVSADTSGDGWIGEGDQGGYYASTTESPFQLREEATPIEVSGSMTDLDFGAGPIRCLAHWGEACEADADCRGASCVYDSGLRATEASGQCTAGVCETPVGSCEPFGGDGAPGTLEESDCFGGP